MTETSQWILKIKLTTNIISSHLTTVEQRFKVATSCSCFQCLNQLFSLFSLNCIWLLFDLKDRNPPVSSVHRILQARILSGLPLPSPGYLPDPGIESTSPAMAGGLFTTQSPGKPIWISICIHSLSHSVYITYTPPRNMHILMLTMNHSENDNHSLIFLLPLSPCIILYTISPSS